MRCSKPSDEDKDCRAMKKNNNNKILLVDDEPDITSLFSLALDDCGLKVDSFNDPLLALENFKQNKSSYALALLDIKMPKMNGFELSSQLRKANDKIKVCFITALDLEEEGNKDLKTTMTATLNNNSNEKPAVIRKPNSIDDFVDRIKAEIPPHYGNGNLASKQIHFLICEACFWCASLLSEVPNHVTISNWHICKEKRIRSYVLL
jgi:DNA-binding response OmpR family regulator